MLCFHSRYLLVVGAPQLWGIYFYGCSYHSVMLLKCFAAYYFIGVCVSDIGWLVGFCCCGSFILILKVSKGVTRVEP